MASERWLRRHERTKNMLPTWRTPHRQEILIYTYGIALAIAALSAVMYLVKPPLFLLWIPAMVMLMISWTMLRITIDSKDSAPIDFLDEYERQFLDEWKRVSYNCFIGAFSIIGFSLVIIGTVLTSSDDPAQFLGATGSDWVYFHGLVTLVVLLACSSLPAIAYARNFPATKENEKEN